VKKIGFLSFGHWSPGPQSRTRSGADALLQSIDLAVGTAVIDMRYENPLYFAEDAGAADLIAGGRLQLGISRGSPEQVIDGWRYFGYEPSDGDTDSDMARRHAEVALEVLEGKGFAQPNPTRSSSSSAWTRQSKWRTRCC
jgi:alkanesulfonate monooxygenase SsuD/methylene tetrahydromethanopterin reductase-like flavin-dependent oxidoreductase (luciferase family)